MKKVFWMSALCVAFVAVMPVAAQQQDSPFYYLNVAIERVFPHRRGYVIDYQTGATGMRTERIYLPLEWFHDGSRREDGMPKGELIYLPSGNSWPYLTVFYRDGEFSHVRLYLRRDRTHQTWAGVPMGANIDSRFDGVESIELKFDDRDR